MADAVCRASLPDPLKGGTVVLDYGLLEGCSLAAVCKPLNLTVEYELSPMDSAGSYQLVGVDYAWPDGEGAMRHEHWLPTPMSELYVNCLFKAAEKKAADSNDDADQQEARNQADNAGHGFGGGVFDIFDEPREISTQEFVDVMSPLCWSFEISVRNYMIDKRMKSIRMGPRQGLVRLEMDSSRELIGVDFQGKRTLFNKLNIGQIVAITDYVMYMKSEESKK